MQSKIHVDAIAPNEKYWHIYQGCGKCQLICLSTEDYNGTFNVRIMDDSNEWTDLIPLKVSHDEDGFIEDLFLFNDKKSAEVLWCNYFIKSFKDNTFVDYTKFLALTEVLHEEYPELLLKGL